MIDGSSHIVRNIRLCRSHISSIIKLRILDGFFIHLNSIRMKLCTAVNVSKEGRICKKVFFDGWRKDKMYSRHLKDYIIYENEDIYTAHWKLHKNGSILIVMDEDERYKGLITFREIKRTYDDSTLDIKKICNINGKFIQSEDNIYACARDLFAEYPFINHIPIVDKERNLIDIMSRERAFWKQYYRNGNLSRMNYAYCIWNAALEAKALGYKSFSLIEFGVAGGNGLVNCEFHVREIERLLGIDIEIYGFDSGEGLPMKNSGYKDMVHIWPGGSYHMNLSALKDRLEKATLVIGDIKETTTDFFMKYSAAPVGCMLIDVDYYSSTVPILKFLNHADEHFLPRINMYFDDIHPEYEFSGENLAIKEFNANHDDVKISPEGLSYPDYRMKTKVCHRFAHEKYNERTTVFCGVELTPDDFEFKLKGFL